MTKHPRIFLAVSSLIGLSLGLVVMTTMAPAAPSGGARWSPGRSGESGAAATGAATASVPSPKRLSSSVRAGAQTTGSKGSAERAVDSMASLARAQTADEADLERTLQEDMNSLTDTSGAPDPAWIPGRPIPGSLRVLDTGLGQDQATLYAFRTERGRVCGGLAGKGAGCFEEFTQEHGVSEMIMFASDGTLIVYGFAPDRVETIRASVDGYSASAPVRNNAYFIELASTSPSVIELEIIPPADGVSETITIPFADAPARP